MGRHHRDTQQFERIGMSRDYQEKFLLEQIAEYDELLASTRAPREPTAISSDHREAEGRTAERLKNLLAEARR